MSIQTAPKTTTTVAANADRARPIVLGLFRIVMGFLFLCHGLQGFGFFGGIDGAGLAMAFGEWPGWWASLIEVVGSACVLAGFGTRTAAFLLSGVMAYAYFVHHAPMALMPMHNGGEPAAMYSWVFLLLAAFGPGAFALRR
ncbi:putative oxidoreductase [Saccharopolyspora antimicrobica]|uniref:Oxidoreductase n=1 Tax=Saccharopolyspora antimicrobica TaxID=455193 RepID=A0A1I4XK03_9PSEU|nr:DoxX family protein [Saccharopolyspora antimicrobica]RKT84544.1 putative oxidoreductase [Saccharopolyspora antimicrobica]SFN26181.1 putative oxidoreductase [Saccharopolyspora antimicrobica]